MFNRNETNENMTIVSVDYDEGKPETYRGLVISLSEDNETRINSGDFRKDMRHFLDEFVEQKYSVSSSVHSYMSECGDREGTE